MKINVSIPLWIWTLTMLSLASAPLPGVADGMLLTTSITDTLTNQSYWNASYNFSAGLQSMQDPWSSDPSLAQREDGNGCEGWILYKAALGKKITGARLTCAPFSLPVKMQLKVDEDTWTDLAIGSHEEVVDSWTWTRDTYISFSADEVRVYTPAGDPWNYPLIGTVELTLSSETVIDRSVIDSSIVDTLVDQRYWDTSSNFNAGLQLEQDPWSSDPYYAQRQSNNSGEGWISYKAAPGKRFTCAKLDCASFGSPVEMQAKLDSGTWVDLAACSRQEVTGAWTWTEDSYSGFLAGEVRVYAPASDPWSYPLIGTVELTVADETLVDSSIVDTLVDQRYWYASSNFGAGVQSTQSPLSADPYLAQRLPESTNTPAGWISYKAAPGKKFTDAVLTSAPFGIPVKMQAKLDDGTWADLAVASHEQATNNWTWARDSYDGFLADEVRVYTPASDPWSYPLIDTVELTVADETVIDNSIVDTLADQRYWYASSNFNAGLQSVQDPWSADPYLAQRLGSENASAGWISYKAAPGKKFSAAEVTCAPFGFAVKMQVKLDDGTWADLPSIPGSHQEVTNAWTWTRDSYGGFMADEIRVYAPAGNPWSYPLLDTVELTVVSQNVVFSSLVDTLVDQRYWYASSNICAGLQSAQDPWSLDPYLAQRLNTSAGWISYKIVPGEEFQSATLTYAPLGLSAAMQMKLEDGTWTDMAPSSHEEITNAWTWARDSYTGFSADEIRAYVPAGSPWNCPMLATVELLIGYKSAEDVSIADAKMKTLGSYIGLTGSITAVFSGSIYAESTDRSSGIRVDKANHGFTSSDMGKVITVTGNVVKDSETNEIFINSNQITPIGAVKVLQPLGMTNIAVGGGGLVDAEGNGQIGVTGGIGLNNIGLLVRTTGLASAGNASGFTLNDGSGVPLLVSLPGIGSRYNGKYLMVTGISSIGPGGVRLIKFRIQ